MSLAPQGNPALLCHPGLPTHIYIPKHQDLFRDFVSRLQDDAVLQILRILLIMSSEDQSLQCRSLPGCPTFGNAVVRSPRKSSPTHDPRPRHLHHTSAFKPTPEASPTGDLSLRKLPWAMGISKYPERSSSLSAARTEFLVDVAQESRFTLPTDVDEQSLIGTRMLRSRLTEGKL